jgi:hypothetical protein
MDCDRTVSASLRIVRRLRNHRVGDGPAGMEHRSARVHETGRVGESGDQDFSTDGEGCEAMSRHYVQFVVIKEIEVDADNDIEAEKLAFAKLGLRDQQCTIASQVSEEGKPTALDSVDPMTNWHVCKEHFNSIDLAFLEGDDA